MMACKGHCTPGASRLEAIGVKIVAVGYKGPSGVGKKGRKFCGACCVVYVGLDGRYCPCCGQLVRVKSRDSKVRKAKAAERKATA